jgi:DNA-binding MarR family transcriptional regulator
MHAIIHSMNDSGRRPPSGAALLLSQVGARVAVRFAERLAELALTPAQVGVLRVVGQSPGLSQQALALRLGAAPSRVVKLVDELEEHGLVERRRSQTDRRHHELHIADGAADRVAAVRRVVREHDADITAALTEDELATLLALLRKVAAAQGLATEGHPGYAGGPPADPPSPL